MKKNWIWKMTLADPPPPPLVWNFPYFLKKILNPSLLSYIFNSATKRGNDYYGLAMTH